MSLVRWISWAVRNRALTPKYLMGYLRMARAALTHPGLHFAGPVFIGPNVRFEVKRGLAQMQVAPFVHFGEGSRVRAHEGTLEIGTKTIIGVGTTINCWIDTSIGANCLLGDEVYICDFDHRTSDLNTPIKDQGIIKTPTRIGDDVWVGTKAVITRGSDIGSGCVVGAASVVRGSFEPGSILVGAPAKVVRQRP